MGSFVRRYVAFASAAPLLLIGTRMSVLQGMLIREGNACGAFSTGELQGMMTNLRFVSATLAPWFWQALVAGQPSKRRMWWVMSATYAASIVLTLGLLPLELPATAKQPAAPSTAGSSGGNDVTANKRTTRAKPMPIRGLTRAV